MKNTFYDYFIRLLEKEETGEPDKDAKDDKGKEKPEAPPEEEKTPEEQEAEEVEKKLRELSETGFARFKEIFDKKSTIILDKIRNEGIDLVMKDFIDKVFLPTTSTDEQLFISLRYDEFIEFMMEQFSSAALAVVKKPMANKPAMLQTTKKESK
ncbi:MAG TPA: hypothetical protein PLA71_00565 [Saccharofermentans sp.]|nr:hypothetical protein [Saccharofermentans sp.]